MAAGSRAQTVDILVIGLPETGKTTFIDTLSRNAQTGQPHGWHAGNVSLNSGLTLRLLEPPAAYVFEDNRMRELVARSQAGGYIILTDSTMPDRFGRMTAILNILQAQHPAVPAVMAANKQDHPQAWTVEDIRLALDVPDDIEIIPCASGDVNTVAEVVQRLVARLNR